MQALQTFCTNDTSERAGGTDLGLDSVGSRSMTNCQQTPNVFIRGNGDQTLLQRWVCVRCGGR